MGDLVERLIAQRTTVHSGAYHTMQEAANRIEELEAALSVEQGRTSDAEYMRDAYAMMLGTKGRQVAKAWRDSGLCRIHVSWGPEAPFDDGEAMAQCFLDIIEAEKTAVPLTREELEKF